MKEYIDKTAVKAEIEKRIASLESIGSENYLHDNYPEQYAMLVTLKSLKFSLDTLEVKEVNITEMADDYYDALMEEAAVWMDEGTMCHCRLAYYNGCKDVLNKIQKGE